MSYTALASQLSEVFNFRLDTDEGLPDSTMLAAARSELELMHKVVEHFPVGLMVYDKSLRLVLCNQRQKDLLEYPPQLFAKGMPTLEDIFRFNAMRGEYGPGDVEIHVKERMKLAAKREAHVFRRMRPNGVLVEVRGVPLPDGGFVTTYLDITTREARDFAPRVGETRVENTIMPWQTFVDRCDAVLGGRSYDKSSALHYIELNDYKMVKQQYGDAPAKALFTAVGQRIAQSIRSTDLIGYLGEDVFAVLQVGIQRPSDVARLEAAMVALTRNPFSIGPVTISGRISVGLALSPRDGYDAETLRTKAHASMQRNKAEQAAPAPTPAIA